MFLSDELLKLGLAANPKNNLSQANQCDKMMDLLNKKSKNGFDTLKLINVTKFVIKELNNRGFNFYKLDIFWMAKTTKSSNN